MTSIESQCSAQSLKETLQKHEDQLLDFDQNICLLCRRAFRNNDLLKRHISLSGLHTSRLKILKKNIFTPDQLEKLGRKERETLYRDRARERRLKYGQPDKMLALEPMLPMDQSATKISSSQPLPSNNNAAKPLGLDNKGAALLSKMGWVKGTGLGKNNEGMTDILKIESHVGTSGLGSKSHKLDPNLSYKEAVKKMMYQRYYEISEEEQKEKQDFDDEI